jgi:hypothetical protein
MNKTQLALLLSVSTLFFGLSGMAFAADSSSGCGLGWEVSQKQSLLSSAIRSTTNAFLPNTFSMTSGTSGCSKHTIVKNDAAAVYFAVNNRDSLLVEMAQGKGEYLRSFASTLGCKSSDMARFTDLTQTKYDSIIGQGSEDGIRLYQAVRGEMLKDSVLSKNCVNFVI